MKLLCLQGTTYNPCAFLYVHTNMDLLAILGGLQDNVLYAANSFETERLYQDR